MNLVRHSFEHQLLVAMCLVLPLMTAGCANFVETRAIMAFTEALEEQDLEGLKDSTSSRFGQKALRNDDSVKDFSVLRLPKGDIEVVKVDRISDTEKRVTGEVGGSKFRRLRYRLLKDEKTGKWVVDDVFVKKRKDGVESTKAVTELMDLIATVREFLKAWSDADRSAILRLSDPDLGTVLGAMPDDYLKNLAQRAIDDRTGSKFKPEAQMDDDVAIVRLPGKSGQMLISFSKVRSEWLISDVAVESRRDKEHIPSVKQMATVLRSASTFLDAYAAGDKKTLKTVSEATLFENSLEPAVLSSVQLPTSTEAADLYQVKLESGFADFIVTLPHEVVKLSLSRVEAEDSDTPVEYLVNEVTIYEVDGNQEKRLSALFLSHAMVDLFAESLSLRELDTGRMMSTPDFQRRVWRQLDEKMLMKLPMPEIENAPPRVLTTVFMGPKTEVTVRQGTRALVYVLQDRDGQLLIDDVLMPVSGRPNSLKKTLEALIPVMRFADGLANGNMDLLQRTSSKELNLAVWHNTEHVPSVGLKLPGHFAVPLTSLEMLNDEAVVGLGDDLYGARVWLVREGERFVVHDARLIAGPEIRQRIDLKEAMRMELSRFRGGYQSSAKAAR